MDKIIENEHYYNNCFSVVDDIVEFERVYMVDENKFNSETYEELRKVYESLPHFIGNSTYLPCWYGDEEKGDKHFLSVSFELSGLQFWGKLPVRDFLQWETKFNKLIEQFPFKY